MKIYIFTRPYILQIAAKLAEYHFYTDYVQILHQLERFQLSLAKKSYVCGPYRFGYSTMIVIFSLKVIR